MRVRVAFASAAFGLLASACAQEDAKYLRQGVGTELYAQSLVSATQLQEIYIGYICQQAGLRVVVLEGDIFRCNDTLLGGRDWEIFVQAGMNDIDRRCDAYLAWLYSQKRTTEPVLKQLADTAAATTAIMRIAGVGADPITAVAIAFGLAANTFTNIQSSLLLEVNHSTVQTLVLSRREDFRTRIIRTRIDNRPAAIHALQSYLRICAPFTIETEINTTLTTLERGGPAAAVGSSPVTMPESVVAPPVVRPVIRSTQTVTVTPPPPRGVTGAVTDIERRSISLESARSFQRALCVEDTGDFGASGSATRVQLREFYRGQLYPRDTAASDTVVTAADLNRLRNAQAVFPSCQAAGLRSGFEVGVFSRPVDVGGTVDPMKTAADIVRALEKNNLPVPQGLRATTFGPAVVAGMREAIPSLRAKFNLPGDPVLDRPLYNQIIRSGAL